MKLLKEYPVGLHMRESSSLCDNNLVTVSKDKDLVAFALESKVLVQHLEEGMPTTGGGEGHGSEARKNTNASSGASAPEPALRQWMTSLEGLKIENGFYDGYLRSLPQSSKVERCIFSAEAEKKSTQAVQLDWSARSSVPWKDSIPRPLLGVVTCNRDLVVYAPPKRGDYEPQLVYTLSGDARLIKQVAGVTGSTGKTKGPKRAKKDTGMNRLEVLGISFVERFHGGGTDEPVLIVISALVGPGSSHQFLLCEVEGGPTSSAEVQSLNCSLKARLEVPGNAGRSRGTMYHHRPWLKFLDLEDGLVVLAACFTENVCLYRVRGEGIDPEPALRVLLPPLLIPTCFDATLVGSEVALSVGFAEGSVGRCSLPVRFRGEDKIEFEVKQVHSSSVSGLCHRASSSCDGSLALGDGKIFVAGEGGTRMGACDGRQDTVLSLISRCEGKNPYLKNLRQRLRTNVECISLSSSASFL
ncbi:hypothetical protein HOP50_17g80430 [Chloropicon primus]|uniref:Uncharacterized protein n=1 Tax=Chloropicon primus TaxID=1764295 RepID=A0A5B8MYQ9_9CHLO|nr:hypothetical protein A3770_17p80190 [Chloropicon primus]UPR04698.1 hypothetical protein HOP50_17g80430 [Chloropicon primus]|mmetsp:Transcript_11125/g.31078  ORF Transcript_11125/g.31078 Transcript_11125/m.31078 type:complete len:470 (-) Transcript_11125:30-1439(-)|eukprot:QDZ25501.1 hypothetical protein A3770_17p80190 [Chloropicon primus]